MKLCVMEEGKTGLLVSILLRVSSIDFFNNPNMRVTFP